MAEPIRTTIVFPRRDDKVLLGMKRRGFGEGWWNGFGGKLKGDEGFEDNARRETFDEAGLKLTEMRLVAHLLFYFAEELKVVSAVFVSNEFDGQPVESEEMRPQWFKVDALPFDTMWPADRLWIPQALNLSVDAKPLNFAVYFTTDKKFTRLQEVSEADVASHFR